jgi:hypothetical protein
MMDIARYFMNGFLSIFIPATRFFKKLRWFEWLHHFYILGAVGYWVFLFFSPSGSNQSTRELWLTLFFGLYFVIILIAFLGVSIVNGKKARYAEANKMLHEAMHASRDAYRYLVWCNDDSKKTVQFNEETFRAKLQQCLTAMAGAFSLVTGVSCRTCIKTLGLNKDTAEGIFVTTLARDGISAKKCEDKDCQEGKQHWLLKNTDFRLIFYKRIRYFFCGNLPNENNYENTKLANGVWINKGDGSVEPWPLDYKACIVWPIRYVYARSEIDESNKNDQDLYGFLTVDSSSRNTFDRRYDVEMGAAIADALFSVLDMYANIKKVN